MHDYSWRLERFEVDPEQDAIEELEAARRQLTAAWDTYHLNPYAFEDLSAARRRYDAARTELHQLLATLHGDELPF